MPEQEKKRPPAAILNKNTPMATKFPGSPQCWRIQKKYKKRVIQLSEGRESSRRHRIFSSRSGAGSRPAHPAPLPGGGGPGPAPPAPSGNTHQLINKSVLSAGGGAAWSPAAAESPRQSGSEGRDARGGGMLGGSCEPGSF